MLVSLRSYMAEGVIDLMVFQTSVESSTIHKSGQCTLGLISSEDMLDTLRSVLPAIPGFESILSRRHASGCSIADADFATEVSRCLTNQEMES